MISVKRSQPAPASLNNKKSYSRKDVRKQLRNDFSDKCYLCEGKTYGSFQIDHLRPQKGFPELVYTWENLFPAHGDTCNQRRIHWEKRPGALRRDGEPVRWPEDGLLDCAQTPDVRARLLQWFDNAVGDIKVFFAAADPEDAEARNTAEYNDPEIPDRFQMAEKLPTCALGATCKYASKENTDRDSAERRRAA